MSESPSSDGWLKGTYYDGRASSGHPARIRLLEGELVLEHAAEQRRLSASGARLGVQVGSAASYLHFHEGGFFESLNQGALASLARSAGAAGSRNLLHYLESHLRLIAVSAVLVLAALIGGMVYGVPWVAEQIARRVPVHLEQYLGEQAVASLDRFWLEPSELDLQKQAELHAAFAPHLAALEQAYPAHKLQVLLRSSEAIGANALALPAGIIIFTDDLIRLAENDEELIAILAHEVGHVTHRHSLRSIVQSSLALWLVMSVTGDLSAASDLATSLPAILANLSYVRGMEREADDFALAFMLAGGIEPSHFANIMLRLDPQEKESGGGLSDFLSTHPPTPERIRRFLDQD